MERLQNQVRADARELKEVRSILAGVFKGASMFAGNKSVQIAMKLATPLRSTGTATDQSAPRKPKPSKAMAAGGKGHART
eukprot:4083800-Pyramimonas_sp.AAC.1